VKEKKEEVVEGGKEGKEGGIPLTLLAASSALRLMAAMTSPTAPFE